MSGKGSKRRPTDEEQYKQNWDAIFGNKRKEVDQKELSETEKKETDNELRNQTN